MSNEDRQVSEQVRRILTSFWIDLSELRFSCTRGTLRFTGILRRLASEERRHPLSAPLIEVLGQEIKRLRGVTRVYFTGVTIDDCWVDAEVVETVRPNTYLKEEEES